MEGDQKYRCETDNTIRDKVYTANQTINFKVIGKVIYLKGVPIRLHISYITIISFLSYSISGIFLSGIYSYNFPQQQQFIVYNHLHHNIVCAFNNKKKKT